MNGFERVCKNLKEPKGTRKNPKEPERTGKNLKESYGIEKNIKEFLKIRKNWIKSEKKSCKNLREYEKI